jgi:hypothetical protein
MRQQQKVIADQRQKGGQRLNLGSPQKLLKRPCVAGFSPFEPAKKGETLEDNFIAKEREFDDISEEPLGLDTLYGDSALNNSIEGIVYYNSKKKNIKKNH